MVITTVIVAAILSGGQSADTRWPLGLLHSPRLAALLRPARVSESVVHPYEDSTGLLKMSDERRTAYIAERDKKEREAFNQWNTARAEAKDLFLKGQYDAVIRRVEAYLEDRPSDSATLSLLVDAAFAKGKPEIAFNAVGPLVGSFQAPEILARASLACSSLGEVYDGQAEYCTNLILFLGPCKDDLARSLPAGRTAKEVRLLSLLSLSLLGNSDDDPVRLMYAKLALQQNPGDPLAGYMAGTVLLDQGKAKEALAAMAPSAKRATGGLLQTIQEKMDLAAFILSRKKA